MESNNCVCINYYLKVLEKMLNSIINATVQVTQNANTPSTDSGYVANRNPGQNFNSNLGSDWLSTSFYTGMILIALLLLFNGMKKRQSKLN